MNTNTSSDKKEKDHFSPSEMTRSQVDYLLYNVFKPPKYDTEFCYYTEVFSDWVERK
jgi:hypothetical protein